VRHRGHVVRHQGAQREHAHGERRAGLPPHRERSSLRRFDPPPRCREHCARGPISRHDKWRKRTQLRHQPRKRADSSFGVSLGRASPRGYDGAGGESERSDDPTGGPSDRGADHLTRGVRSR
jgi:hypothetical protein